MVILHIASLTDVLYSGVGVVVPQYIIAQQKKATVGLMNISNDKITGVRHQIEYKKPFTVDSLPEPFRNSTLVIFHEVYYWEYLQISDVLVQNKIPYIIVPHGCLTREAQSKKRLKKSMANLLFFHHYINHAFAIQCLSEREFANTHFQNEKFIAINGVNSPVKTKTAFNQTRVKLVYIGRLDIHTKGLDLMVEAVKILSDFLRTANCTLHIYGPGSQRERTTIESWMYNKKIEDIVILNHEISGESKENLLLSSDIFIQTSRTEAMPMGILEALSYGIPCIVTEGTSLSEIIKTTDAGWPAKTAADSIAAAIQKAIEERSEWHDKSIHAVRAIQRQFEWDKVTDQTLKKYNDIMTAMNN